MNGFKFQKEKRNISQNFKGLFQSSTPFGKRKFIRLVGLTIHQIHFLSISRINCEIYLFKDYRLLYVTK